MQQQVNQMIMQIAAGTFGMRHLEEQKKQTPLTPEQQKQQEQRQQIEAQRENYQAERNYTKITGLDITDTKAAERLAKEKGISPEDMQGHLNWALDIAATNVGEKYSNRVNAKAAKELAQRIAKTPKILFDESTTPTPPKSGGDK